jgi:RNA polymerase nonessential primary-like sigma factor
MVDSPEHRAIMNQARTVRLPVHVIRELNQVLRAKRHLEKNSMSTGDAAERREASIEDIAYLTGKTPRKSPTSSRSTSIPRRSTRRSISIPRAACSICCRRPEPVARRRSAAPRARDAHALAVAAVRQASARDRTPLRLNHIEPATLEELADEMGLTRERVRQIQQEALVRLKRFFASNGVRKDAVL